MPKFNVQLAQLVREVASCVVEAPSRIAVDLALGEIFDDSDDLQWESDDGWGIEADTHSVDDHPVDIEDAAVDFKVDDKGVVERYVDGEIAGLCGRCDAWLERGFCTDSSCPFSDHKQTCPVGWCGHTEKPEFNRDMGPADCICGGRKPVKTFAVYVVDSRHVKYLVESNSADEAQKKVEASEDADVEFGGKGLDGSEWYVDEVEEL